MKDIRLSTIRAVELKHPSEDEGVNALKIEFHMLPESDPQRPTGMIPLSLVAAKHSEVLNALKLKLKHA